MTEHMASHATCANCGDTIWGYGDGPSRSEMWTHERNGDPACPGFRYGDGKRATIADGTLVRGMQDHRYTPPTR